MNQTKIGKSTLQLGAKRLAGLVMMALLVSACGGSGGDGGSGASTSSGVFKDTNVSGLSYVSGEESGITDVSGQFTFETDSSVTFSIGGVELGTTQGSQILTPLEIAGGDKSLLDTDVTNIVRFLMMLDTDEDPGNGIEISSAVQAAAEDWEQVDFTSSSFDSSVSTIVSEVSVADGRTATLPSATEAHNHFESTLRCITAGAFKGTYTGDDSGTFGFLVDANTGSVSGIAYSAVDDVFIDLSGGQTVSTDTQRSFTSGITSTGGAFEGEFVTPSSVSGTWSSLGYSGSFNGARIGGDIDAQLRFTGKFTGSDEGLFSFDVDADGNVTGVAYSIQGDELDSLSGTLSGTSLSVTTSQGSTVNGTLDTSTGTVTGNWSSSDGVSSGSFTGSGCQLNP